jgi:hypothetical protein
MSKTLAKTLAFSTIAMMVTCGFLAGLYFPSSALAAALTMYVTLFASALVAAFAYSGFCITLVVFSSGFATIFATWVGIFAGFALPAAGLATVSTLTANEAINSHYARKG